MNNNRYHLTIRKMFLSNKETKNETFNTLVEKYKIDEVNFKRFARYGILSGNIEDEFVSELIEDPMVLAVERDRDRVSSGTIINRYA